MQRIPLLYQILSIMNKKICLLVALMSLSLPGIAQSWSELGSGTNALSPNDVISDVVADYNGNVYTAGYFTNASNKYYVARWDGSTWSALGNLNANDLILTLATDAAGNVYAAGMFANSSDHTYVARWNGSSWSEMGSGANALDANGTISTLATDAAGNVYAAGSFTNSAGKWYVAKWNGTTWTELGAGSQALNADNGIQSVVTDASGNVYAAGNFSDANGKKYVAKWNGSTWSELGTGANALNVEDGINALATDATGNVYAAGFFKNGSGEHYVARWNGTSWSETGAGANVLHANDWINTLATDAAGNLYAAGIFTQAGAKYVARWNGTSWSALGGNTLNAAGWIQSLATDPTGSVYAGGGFTNSNGKWYVARYGLPLIDSMDVRTVSNAPAVIQTYQGTLQVTVFIFPGAVSQDVHWSIVPVTGTATINSLGLVKAQSNGTVWAKAVSVAYPSKSDSLLITLSNQKPNSIADQGTQATGIALYPNPTTDIAVLHCSRQHPPLRLQVCDALGKVLLERAYEANALLSSVTLSLTGLPAGNYFLHMIGKDIDWTTKLVKQ